MDVDLCGPSVPYLLKLENRDVHQCEAGWIPVYTDESKTLGVLSIGFLTKSRNDSVVWRGPKKTGLFWKTIFLIIHMLKNTKYLSFTIFSIYQTVTFGCFLGRRRLSNCGYTTRHIRRTHYSYGEYQVTN